MMANYRRGCLVSARVARVLLGAAVGAVCLAMPSSLCAQARFTGLGFFGGYESVATDVSADGRVVVGFSEPNMFRWTIGGSLVRPHPKQGHPALSADGSIVAGIFISPENNFEPFRWSVNESFTLLGDLPGGPEYPSGRALDISADGRTVVGHGTTSAGEEAFRWTAESRMVSLGDLSGGDTASRAHGVSADGTVIVGYGTGADNRRQAVRWTTQSGITALPRGGAQSSEANAVSADGVVVVGYNEFPPSSGNVRHFEAFRWTPTGGMFDLGDLPGGRRSSIAHDVSADGSVIVGSSDTLRDDGFDTRAAFYWTQDRGMLDLYDLLIAQGATNLDGWRLSEARGVSADGMTVVGTGVRDGRIEAFIATVPEPSSVVLAVLAAGLAIAILGVRRRVIAFRCHRDFVRSGW